MAIHAGLPEGHILFIDEAHTLIGAGGAAGGSDAANLLKPALARGEFRTIAATTWSEYKRYFEQDAALARRFQLVKLDEPSPADTLLMLRGLRDAYETSHGVYVRDEALDAAVKLSSRYITGRQLPDKAVDVLDTACSRVRLSLSSKPDRIEDRERRVQALERELGAIDRDTAVGAPAGAERRAGLQAEIACLETELEGLQERWQREKGAVDRLLELRRQTAASPRAAGSGAPTTPDQAGGASGTDLDAALEELAGIQGTDPLIHYEVSPGLVAKVVSDWTGVPVGNLLREEAKSLLDLEDLLTARVKGQDAAVATVARRIRGSKVGLRDPSKPIGVFLFVGPSGVGKTECALAVADLVFGGERFMTTINMSEFQEKHTVSRLIGSPPGYVGFGEGGRLTEAVRQRPYSVVLLDEVEKADPQVMNLFYQVFDKGTLADGEGREIDFKNTVLFLTSNLGSEVIIDLCGEGQRPEPEAVAETIRPMLSDHFGAALLARMAVVPFLTLEGEAMEQIVDLKLAKLKAQLEQTQGLTLQYGSDVVAQVASRSAEITMGARNIDFIIERELAPRITSLLLESMGAEQRPQRIQVRTNGAGGFDIGLGV